MKTGQTSGGFTVINPYFVRGSVFVYEGCSEDIFSFLYFLDTLFLLCDSKSCTLIDIYIYIYILRLLLYSFTYFFMCCFFSLFMHMLFIYCMQSFIFLFHTKMPWWVLFKVFQKYRLSKSFLPWTLFLQSFSSVCVRIKFYCIQQVYISWVFYDFSRMFICLLWFCHGLPNERLLGHIWIMLRTYVIG